MSVFICFNSNLFINYYWALVFHLSSPSAAGADFVLGLLVMGFGGVRAIADICRFAVKEACSDV